jgi:polysaccharide pyruvyl transferase WcaK-like protein
VSNSKSKGVSILLIHGAGAFPRNIGDDAQAYSAADRLRRLIPGVEVRPARMYAEDDGALWPGVKLVASPRLYVVSSSWLTVTVAGILRGMGLGRIGAVLFHLSLLTRVVRLLVAGWCWRRFGVVPLMDARGRNAVKEMGGVDAVYCSGGGNLNDIWLRSELVPRAVSYRLAHVMGKPCVVSGQGVGPLKSRAGKAILGWGLRHVEFFACRDLEESAAHLRGIGVAEERMASLGDDAFDLVPASAAAAEEILVAEGVPVDGKPLVMVHVRFTNFVSDFGEKGSPYTAAVLDGLIERTGCQVVFIPITNCARRAGDRDIGDAFDVYAHMKRRESVSFLIGRKYSPPEMKAVVARSKALIAYSYHAWVFALTSGVPGFGLFSGEYFRGKSSGLFAWYGRLDWVWDIERSDPRRVAAMIGESMGSGDGDGGVRRKTAELVANVEVPARRLAAILGGVPYGAGSAEVAESTGKE